MSTKEIEKSQSKVISDDLFERMFHEPEQLKLFEQDPYAHFSIKAIRKLKQLHPNKIIIDSNKVEKYRLMAAFLGAGFHPFQYQEIMYNESDPKEVGKLGINSLGQRYRVSPFRATSNRMRDEVSEELFTSNVPTTQYDNYTRCYITSEADIKQILAFDFDNLRTCRELNFDLLYERED